MRAKTNSVIKTNMLLEDTYAAENVVQLYTLVVTDHEIC